MLTKIKQKVQRALASEAKVAHQIGLTPNAVTVIGFLLAVAGAIAYGVTTAEQPFWLIIALLMLLASGFCDMLDGILARTFNQVSAFGGFFDSILDRYVDALIFAAIIYSGLCHLLVGLAALISSLMVSYSRARAEAAGVKMESIGIAERPERMLILAGASVAAFFWLPALNIGVAVIAVLATFTVLQRGLHAYGSLKVKQNVATVKMTVGA